MPHNCQLLASQSLYWLQRRGLCPMLCMYQAKFESWKHMTFIVVIHLCIASRFFFLWALLATWAGGTGEFGSDRQPRLEEIKTNYLFFLKRNSPKNFDTIFNTIFDTQCDRGNLTLILTLFSTQNWRKSWKQPSFLIVVWKSSATGFHQNMEHTLMCSLLPRTALFTLKYNGVTARLQHNWRRPSRAVISGHMWQKKC